jgi:hypothetical protein
MANEKGLVLLITAPRTVRKFEPLKGETISIFDPAGKVLWSVTIPAPINNPGMQIREIDIGLLTQRSFEDFCQANQ